MKRKIIEINEEKCNGCGLCINVCDEAALELKNGKAVLTKEFYCDGLGACLDVCPVDALKIVEKESEEYNTEKTVEHVKKIRGEENAKKVHGLGNHKKHDSKQINNDEPMKCGCPGTMMRDFRNKNEEIKEDKNIKVSSTLRQWPTQLHLLSPAATYFKNSDILITADCVPFAFANFHSRFLKGKSLAMFCPKLDSNQESYLEKLTEIFKHQSIKSITVVRMEVPCCSGALAITEKALKASGKNIVLKDYVISVEGEII